MDQTGKNILNLKRILPTYLLLITCLAMATCATVRTPSGGPADTVPPQPIAIVPPNYSTNFNSRTIVIEFDEWVQLNDIYNQLIISPPLDEIPEVQLKKKALFVTIKGDLRENTTYSFSFGDGVRDYRENNPASDLRYVFSTGDELDSLALAGKVIDSYTNEPIVGAKVMLYSKMADSIPMVEKPLYFGLTQADGTFEIPYLSEGKFRALALLDNNSNYLLDSDEPVAWFDEIVSTSPDTTQQIFLRMSTPEPDMLFIEDYSSDSSGFLKVKFNRKTDMPDAQSLQEGINQDLFYHPRRDTLYYWIKDKGLDRSEEIIIRDNGAEIDTLSLLHWREVGKQTLRIAMPMGQMRHDKPVELQFYRPITWIDETKIRMTRDSVALTPEVDQQDPFTAVIRGRFSPDRSYKIEILPGAFISREGWTNDTIVSQLRTFPLDHYGSLNFSLVGLEDGVDYLFEMQKENGPIPTPFFLTRDTTLRFPRLEPGKYVLRLIEDRNGNKRWNPGDYSLGFQPENVIYFPEQLQMRSNWEQDLQWEVNGLK
ncbi:MAG: hypothetical protein HKN32_08630 [Flavobacteriales bacterium]|nr:hypothetical protein [Flavobacteriales bacterium]